MEQPDGNRYNSTAQVYELFEDNGDWLGAYNTYAEAADARRARRWSRQPDMLAITTPEADSSLAPWTLDPEAAAILADLTANPICQTRHFETYAVTRAEWTSYVDPRVDELNAIYTRHLLAIDAAVRPQLPGAVRRLRSRAHGSAGGGSCLRQGSETAAGRREGVMARLPNSISASAASRASAACRCQPLRLCRLLRSARLGRAVFRT
ncbi:hypothetical protein AB5I41_31665 [Sphingomonas sp. MMS24-JH45]